MNTGRTRHRHVPLRCALIAAAALGAALSACGPDGPDVYTAPVEDPAVAEPGSEPADSSEPVDGSETPSTVVDDAAPQASDPTESVPANGETVDVRALDNSFIDEEIEIVAGTEVHWQNRGRNDHDVVPVDDGEEWGVELEAFTPGDSYSHVFGTPGTYRYYCTVHGTEDVGMVGTIIVN